MTLAEVPYPPDTRAKGWRFELDYERIEQSDTWALALEVPLAQHCLVMMWLVAWQQVPCGSFPSDEATIRAKCRIPPETWAACRDILMRGWWVADDGRLYHKTLTDRVLNMLDTRGADRTRQDARRNLFDRIRGRDGRACVYCGHTKYLTLDRLLPMSRGGDNDENNLAIACRPCTSKKRDITPDEAGFTFMNQGAADRWRAYKKSAGETPGDDECIVGDAGYTQSNDTGTGTGTIREEKEKTPPPPFGGSSVVRRFPPWFDRFWSVYPRKVGKYAAAKAFAKLRADADLSDRVIAAVERQKSSPAWTKDGGQFVPHPATWLNQGRWMDEAEAPQKLFEGVV